MANRYLMPRYTITLQHYDYGQLYYDYVVTIRLPGRAGEMTNPLPLEGAVQRHCDDLIAAACILGHGPLRTAPGTYTA